MQSVTGDREMATFRPIICTDPKNASQHFFFLETEVGTDPDGRFLKFLVHLRNPPRPDEDDLYFAEFRFIGSPEVQSMTLNNSGRSHYRGKGITEAVFAEVARLTGLTLVSSSDKYPKLDTERREPEATKVWERLVSDNRARYDSTTDRYTYIP
jgi:hypothetical protein